jgi:hypothetical protein
MNRFLMVLAAGVALSASALLLSPPAALSADEQECQSELHEWGMWYGKCCQCTEPDPELTLCYPDYHMGFKGFHSCNGDFGACPHEDWRTCEVGGQPGGDPD